LAYPISFGPACWLSSHTGTTRLQALYRPLIWTFGDPSRVVRHETEEPVLGALLQFYAELGARRDWKWVLAVDGVEMLQTGKSTRADWDSSGRPLLLVLFTLGRNVGTR
jgi:hypothetical protein